MLPLAEAVGLPELVVNSREVTLTYYAYIFLLIYFCLYIRLAH